MTNINLPSISLNITNSVSAGPGGVTREVLKPPAPPLVTTRLYVGGSTGSTPYISYSIDPYEKLAEPVGVEVSTGATMAITPDQSTLIVTDDAEFALYDLTVEPNTESLFPGTKRINAHAEYSPDGSVLALSVDISGDAVKLYDVNDGYADLADLSPDPSSLSERLAFSPDGKYLAVGMGSTPRVRVYDTTSLPYTFVNAIPDLPVGSFHELAWSADSTQLAVHTGSALNIYDTSTFPFTLMTTPTAPGSTPSEMRYRPDGAWLVVVDTEESWLYDTSTDPYTRYADSAFLVENFVAPKFVSWSRDSERLAIGSNSANPVKIYDTSGSIPWSQIDGPDINPPTVINMDFD